MKEAGIYREASRSKFNVRRITEDRVETSIKKQKVKLKLLEKARVQLEKDNDLAKLIRNGNILPEPYVRLDDHNLDVMVD